MANAQKVEVTKTAAQTRLEALKTQVAEAQALVDAEAVQMSAAGPKDKELALALHDVCCHLCGDAKKKMQCPVEQAKLRGEGVINWAQADVAAWVTRALTFKSRVTIAGWTLT